MSEINKLDNKQCPFDPDQYKYNKKIDIEVDNVAPTGSLPWALIQVYLGKEVHRSGWNAPIEHMRLTHKSEVGNTDDGAAYIEKSDKGGYWSRWQPTQEDLMACDWSLLKLEPKPDDCMLSFDLKIGTDQYQHGDGVAQDWGYMTKAGDISVGESTFGVLIDLQSIIGVGSISTFRLFENPIGTFDNILLEVDTQNQPDLGSKAFEVTANGSTYNLGSTSNSTTDFGYTSDGAKQLGDLLKQNVGKTLHFCFNWK
ncbi:Thoeris anti-defense Tad2 family protein [Xenorhabdus bovienii]|uniref:DUF2829 domain-containing protein n=1 Tax=Xenorhabdus bovienii str. kraussei Becker Underwood TaxID=1398204 RepID=A0A077PYQ7_XENBV|nr:MW1434 family type I TA system toxin [Xenorhabdus bovienii]CDH24949.1 conserved hypothetical protein [Xenorhabdus bovienii str. kraussei Becker Underwood]